MGISHSWNGTVLTVTSDSGTSSADLKGAKGDTGIRGPQGVEGKVDTTNVYTIYNPPTAEEVGARPNTWLPTLEELGAASVPYVNARTLLAEDPNNDGNVVLKYGGNVEGGGEGGSIPSPGGGLTAAEVQAMIDASLGAIANGSY